ncbi:vacuolar protein sorting-associated protein 52 homolog [Petromyzon marinus]|uniref:vacuolar protein sorting-associated protein 52 homolog n=1 Tax=Petromyzon marinus TaxID=7757 RepID=UPI003F7185D7
MEEMLSSFQTDLSSISSEIQTLQEQSVAMNVKLRNRQAVRGELSQLVDELVVPDTMITAILELPVTERDFLEQLQELNNKINYAKEQAFRETLACQDTHDVLAKLKAKAIAKVREFILQKIYAFRKPMTNYQMAQNTLLKFRFFSEFLLANERHVAKEVRDEYVDTMARIYYSYFKAYTGRLMKLQYEEVADKDDLMGVEDTAKKGFFSKPSLRNRNTTFTLGNRGAVISGEQLEAPILVPHAAQKQDTRYSFESLFRSQHYALLDNCCREFLFLCDFFMVSGASAHELFTSVMGRSLSMFMKHMDAYVADCYDSIAVFLCIHIILRFKAIMAKRGVPALDKYWDALLELLWPRFELILEMNIYSIRSTDPQRLGAIDTRPHYVTRRYAEFSSAIVSINQSFPNDKTIALLGQLQVEVENFILLMAAEFSSRKEQLVFLINNYDMLLSVLLERAAEDSKEVESFQQLLNARTQEFVEEILAPPFGGMIAFVKEAEALTEKGQLERIQLHEAHVVSLVRGFGSTWKSAIEGINQDVMRSFTNFKNGTGIIQGALTQLIQYYHRFQKVLSQPPFKNLAVRGELINIHHLMVEVKKHKPNF